MEATATATAGLRGQGEGEKRMACSVRERERARAQCGFPLRVSLIILSEGLTSLGEGALSSLSGP